MRDIYDDAQRSYRGQPLAAQRARGRQASGFVAAPRRPPGGAPNAARATFVAVGTPVYPTPPHRSVRAGLLHVGSYLRYLASKRTFGCGCRIFALGIH